jgi:hypothetical protein
MADVRLERVNAVIPYRLIDAILERDFSWTQLRILLALVQLTDGMRRPTERLSTSLLAQHAGMRAPSDSQRASGSFRQSLRELVVAGVILEPERGVFAIERDVTRWRILPDPTDCGTGPSQQRVAS